MAATNINNCTLLNATLLFSPAYDARGPREERFSCAAPYRSVPRLRWADQTRGACSERQLRIQLAFTTHP